MTIETKFNIGDEVWFMNRNKCESSIVEGIKVSFIDGYYLGYIKHTSIDYSLGDFGIYSEYSIFRTKQELLDRL